MQEEDWFGKMEICGQTERIWDAFVRARGDGDEVTLFPDLHSRGADLLNLGLGRHLSAVFGDSHTSRAGS